MADDINDSGGKNSNAAFELVNAWVGIEDTDNFRWVLRDKV